MTSENPTLSDILQLRAREQPEQIAYLYLKDGESQELGVTYAELDRQARAVAASIQSICRPGERAILLYPPGLEFIAAFFGCLYAGIIAVPAYPPRANRNFSRLQAIVGDCEAALALTTAQIAQSIRAHWGSATDLQALRWLATDALEEGIEEKWQKPAIDGDTLAFLQYTSGSTGTPRGVMVSHGNLIHNSECLRERWGHSPASVGVCWVPQFHDLGLIAGILQPMYVGYKAVLLSPTAFIQKPYRWLEAISRYRGTTTCGPNFSFDLCVQKIAPELRATLDLSCLEVVMNGAEPVVSETLASFARAFEPCGFRMSAFRGGYGLAEGTVFVTTSLPRVEGPEVKAIYKSALEQNRVHHAPAPGEGVQEVVSCGPTAGGQQLIIVKPDLHTRCQPDQIGEIWIKGPSVAQGYWKRPEESAATFRAVLDDTKEGPFLRTGDLGFLHDGQLYITGRAKDLIIVRGRNHYPQDIERTVERVHPVLRLNCTAAFSIREHEEEQVVVVQELRRHHAGVDLDQLLGDVFQAVSEEHELALHSIILIGEGHISKTSSGKIQRSACRQRYLEGSFDVIRQATHAEPAKSSWNRAAFLERLPQLDPAERRAQAEIYLVQTLRTLRRGFFYIDVQHSLLRIGLDSLGVAQLKTILEEDLGTALALTTLMEMSLQELSEEIVRQWAAKHAGGEDAVLKSIDALSDAEVGSLLDEMLSLGGEAE